MARDEKGFTLLEIMITLVILVVVLTAASGLFVTLLGQYKQQGKIAETGMERLVGLEILRRDVEHAGYGLPWSFQPGAVVTYNEAVSGVLNDAPTGIPRALLCVNDTGQFTSSDRLVVKSAFVGRDPLSQRWMLLPSSGIPPTWSPDPPSRNLVAGNRVIVLETGVTDDTKRTLVVPGSYFTDFATVASYAPLNPSETRVIYGIDHVNLRMPFNRADYFISNAGVPERCAPGTGVLVKNILKHEDGTFGSPLPLLDCVANFQVTFAGIDTNGVPQEWDGTALSLFTAQQLRDQVKEVRLSILAHEGQRDEAYTHPTSTINVAGVNVSVNAKYRWRVYTLTLNPISLRD